MSIYPSIIFVVTLLTNVTIAGDNFIHNPSAQEIDAGKPVGWWHYQNAADEWGATSDEFCTGNRCALSKRNCLEDTAIRGPTNSGRQRIAERRVAARACSEWIWQVGRPAT